jgi:hypothetical protein
MNPAETQQTIRAELKQYRGLEEGPCRDLGRVYGRNGDQAFVSCAEAALETDFTDGFLRVAIGEVGEQFSLKENFGGDRGARGWGQACLSPQRESASKRKAEQLESRGHREPRKVFHKNSFS